MGEWIQLEPVAFQVILTNENFFGPGGNLGLGLSQGSRWGAVDIDFFAYKEGVFAPTVAALAGDYNDDGKVDAADYVLWRNGGPLLNETETVGSVTVEDYNAWRRKLWRDGRQRRCREHSRALVAVAVVSRAI